MERTLVIFKPCAVQRGICGEIISRFEKKGLKIVAMKMYSFSKEKCAEHYAHLLSKPFYPWIEESMMAAPVVLMALEGFKAVEVVRQMTGSTRGTEAVPGTIRGDYSLSAQENIIHSSDSLETAEVELKRFFSEEDFFEYGQVLTPFIYAPDERDSSR